MIVNFYYRDLNKIKHLAHYPEIRKAFMSINPEYDGSQKKLFLDLVAARIKYLEDTSSRLPIEMEQKQMELKATQDELSKLYTIIPPAPKLVDNPYPGPISEKPYGWR